MKAVSPSPESIRNAFYLGQTLAISDPSVRPLLDDARAHPNYVLFILAHRKKLETMPTFWSWDLRLEDIIEREIKRNKLSMVPENVEEILRAISMPLRCAFWLGWEQVQKLQTRYEQATGIRSIDTSTEVQSSDLQAAQGDLQIPEPEEDALAQPLPEDFSPIG